MCNPTSAVLVVCWCVKPPLRWVMKLVQSVASVTCLYLCTVCAFLLMLKREFRVMQHRETVFKVCVCVCVYKRKRGGGSRRRGRVWCYCCGRFMWKISGASQPLHRVNNDVRTANESLHVDVCTFVSVCLPLGPRASHTCTSMHVWVCLNLHECQWRSRESVLFLHHVFLCIFFLVFIYT